LSNQNADREELPLSEKLNQNGITILIFYMAQTISFTLMEVW